MLRHFIVITIFMYLAASSVLANEAVIPSVRSENLVEGEFVFPDIVSVYCDGSLAEAAGRLLERELGRYLAGEIVISEGSDSATLVLKVAASRDYHAQGYELEVGSGGVIIRGYDESGLFNGCVTLINLVREACGRTSDEVVSLRCRDITDYPDTLIRGQDMQWCYYAPDSAFMYDTARSLALLKYNVIIPELGPILVHEDYPEQVRGDGISREAFRDFVRYCDSWNLEVIPKINALGHGERGVPWLFPLGNGIDIGYEENYEQLFDIIDAYIADCPGVRYMHLGMDEASPCLTANSEKYDIAPAEILVQHANRVAEFCLSRRVIPIIYHDMLLSNEEDIYSHEGVAHGGHLNTNAARPQLLRDIVINYWNYEGFERYRTVENFRREGLGVILTPWAGVSVRTMAHNAPLLDSAVIGSTWICGHYCDDFSVGQQFTRKFFTAKWLQDAFANLAQFSWNNQARVQAGFDPGFNGAIALTDLYWDRPSYVSEQGEAVALGTTDNIDEGYLRGILESLELASGMQVLKGVPFAISQEQVLALGNCSEVDNEAALAQPLPWTIFLNGQSHREITAINQRRGANEFALYTREFGLGSGANQYGREINIRESSTHCTDTWGIGNMAIPRNGYVLSGHGEGLYGNEAFTGRHEVELRDAQNEVVPLGVRVPVGPRQARIAVGKQASSLVFLHTTACETAHYQPDLVTITVEYADGSEEAIGIRYGRDISSYDDACFLYGRSEPQQKWVAAYDVGTELNGGALIYAYEYHNLHPDKVIEAVRFELSEMGQKTGYILLALTAID